MRVIRYWPGPLQKLFTSSEYIKFLAVVAGVAAETPAADSTAAHAHDCNDAERAGACRAADARVP